MPYKFSCSAAGAPSCPFEIRDEDQKELVKMVRKHAKEAHNEDLSKEDVMKYVKNA